MRPFVFLSIFSAATLVAADHTELIDNQAKRVIYTGGWKPMIITIKSDLPFDDIFAKTTSTNTESETPTKRPEGQSGLASTTTVVGLAVGLVGAVCLGLLGALGIYIRRKRRTHDATLHPFSTLDEGEIPIFQSTGALSARTEGISREGGVETETDRDRKARRPNGGIHPAPQGQPSEDEGTAAFPLEDSAPPQPPPRPPSDNLSAPPPYTP